MNGGAVSEPLPLHQHTACCDPCRRLDVRAVEAVEESTAALRGFLRAERDVLDPKSPGDIAEGLVPVAAALVCLVRGDGDAGAIRYLLRKLSAREVEALPIVVAAMVDPETTVRDAFGWITWDENGRALGSKPRLEGTVRSMGEHYTADMVPPSGVAEAMAAADCAEARSMYRRGDDILRIASVYGVSEKRVSRWVNGGRP